MTESKSEELRIVSSRAQSTTSNSLAVSSMQQCRRKRYRIGHQSNRELPVEKELTCTVVENKCQYSVTKLAVRPNNQKKLYKSSSTHLYDLTSHVAVSKWWKLIYASRRVITSLFHPSNYQLGVCPGDRNVTFLCSVNTAYIFMNTRFNSC